MKARINEKETNLNAAVTIDCSVKEALAIAAFLGKMTTPVAEAFGLTGNEYDTLADALEYGDNAYFKLGDFGASSLYTAVNRLPHVELSLREDA